MPRRVTPTSFTAKVGARIRELRVERGMSLAELADAGFLSKGHLSNVERGLAAITTATIERLAQALGLAPLFLFTFPADDELAEVAELTRGLPRGEVPKLRRDLHARLESRRR